MSEGQTCIFQIKPVEFSDAGNYSCHLTVGGGTTVISSARLKVISKLLHTLASCCNIIDVFYYNFSIT